MEWLSLPTLVAVLSALGPTGLLLLLYHDYNRRMDRQMMDLWTRIDDIMKAYKRDIDLITRYYENNVELVKQYERLAKDLASVIHLNTQTMTQLSDRIVNNLYCPLLRERGPTGKSAQI